MMSDPLKLLREYTISGKPVKEKDEYIVFGDMAFPRTAKTNYLVWNKKDEYYTLESLYFFYKKRALQHTAYVKEAAEKKIQIVTRADRKALEDYLIKEKLDKLPTSIDLSAPVPSSIHVSKIQTETEQNDAKRPRLDFDDSVSRKPSERVLAMIEGTSSIAQSAKPETIRDLSKEHGLTKDKIAALRQKALANKRNQIKTTEEDLMAVSLESRRADGPSAVDLTKDATFKERVWRNRSTCLEAASKNFVKSVLPILQTIRAREDGIIGTTTTDGPNVLNSSNNPRIEASLNPNNNDPSKASNRNVSQMPGYSRYDQERFRKEETEGFQINTMGTYRGITLKSITEGAQPKAQNIPGSTAGSVIGLPVNRPNPNNNNNNSIGGYPNSRSSYNASHMQQENIQPNANRKRTSRTPIIIIPAASTSLITMYNAKEILQDLRFISTEEKKNQGFKRENEVLVQRQKEGHSTTPYRVIDNPQKLTSEEWERVVAVFVQGPSWQFKEWPFAGPSEIFSKICAFHLKWDDMNLDQNVAKWAVNVLGLSRTKRHLDRASLIKIWDTLDRYMVKHKPFLRF